MHFLCNSYSLLFANSSRDSTKETISVLGSLSHRNTGSSIKLEEIETDIGSCFPIQVVLFVSFSSSGGAQIDSKSRIAKFLSSFRSSF